MINKNYALLPQSYLFTEIARRVSAYSREYPDKKIIRMGIGDVTQPLCAAAAGAMRLACEEMGSAEGFHGYAPEQGYPFLREAVAGYYAGRGINIDPDSVFISSGAKDDLGGILGIFDSSCQALMQDPVYPVYSDTNVMDGREISYMFANAGNGFLPSPADAPIGFRKGIIYLCSPNNPCGAAYDAGGLAEWVRFATGSGSVILFDAAYEAYVTSADIPRSIFEIEGAEKCAIELCSLSKTAGFTGVRCGWTIVPSELAEDGEKLAPMWLRRQTTRFNGVSYVTQKGAEAIFTPEGRAQTAAQRDIYRRNAGIISKTLDALGIFHTGGTNSPYIWMECPDGLDSWDYFDVLLKKYGVVGTPGAGFGVGGEKYFRLTAFSSESDTAEAMERLRQL